MLGYLLKVFAFAICAICGLSFVIWWPVVVACFALLAAEFAWQFGWKAFRRK